MDERGQTEAPANIPRSIVLTNINDLTISKLVDDGKPAESPPYGREKRAVLTLILIVVNMVNYMDRNTVSAVLDDVKEYFEVSDTSMGLVRTLFVLMLTVSVILFGYLGDRLNRLYLLTIGLLVWAAVVLSVVFLTPSCFPIFVLCRMLVGVGEGSVSTVAPAMISDMFKGRARSILFACFSLMIPVGAGIGYVVYALLGKYFGKWQTGFYFSPGFSMLSVIVIWTLIREDPPRGKAEGASINSTSRRSLRSDLKHILGCKTFMLLSIGHTLQLFVVGAVLFWSPDYAERSPAFLKGGWSKGDGAVYFGICTMSGGLAGVAVGGIISSSLKSKGSTMVSDAYICAGSSLFTAPLFFIGLQFGGISIAAFWVMVFAVVTCISTNWSVMMDASVYVIHPRCRSLALGVQLLITKIGGEAWSAYLIGFISEWCQASHNYKGYSSFYCLHNALYLCCFVMIIAGSTSACSSWYIDDDKKYIADTLLEEKRRTGQHKEPNLTDTADPGVDSREPSSGCPHHHRPLDLPLDIDISATPNPHDLGAMDGPTGRHSVIEPRAISVEKTTLADASSSSSALRDEDRVCPVVEFAAKRVQNVVIPYAS